MLDFRRCDECGAHFPQQAESCPSCGRFAPSARHLIFEHQLLAVGGLPILVALAVLLVPGESAWEAGLMSASFGPLLVALAHLAWRRHQRDPGCHVLRARAIEVELEAVEKDLADSDRRLAEAHRELEAETHPRVVSRLRRELEQDRRLRDAQRRLVWQLSRRLEQLEVDRFREQLRFYEACCHRRLEAPELVADLEARITVAEAHRRQAGPGVWEPVLLEARHLRRQLARGVQRLNAARRLDPLAHVDAGNDEAYLAGHVDEGAIDEQTELQLERIDRSFEAVDELDAHLGGDPDSSGVRLRVDDEVLAALDEAEAEQELEVGAQDRISVDRL